MTNHKYFIAELQLSVMVLYFFRFQQLEKNQPITTPIIKQDHMIDEPQFIAFSHLQYQSKEALKRSQNKNEKDSQPSFAPVLQKADIENIKACLNEGLTIILSQMSLVPIHYEQINATFFETDVKNLKALMNLDKIKQYIEEGDKNQSEVLFVSTFGHQQLTYKPYLLKLIEIANSKGNKKVIIYAQKIQTQRLKQLLQKTKLRQFIEMQLDIPVPFDYVCSQNLLDVLEKFLHDQSKQITKKDVVIFHTPTEDFKKKLFYLTRTKGFHVSTTIIYEGHSHNSEAPNLNTKIYVATNVDSLLKQKYSLSSLYLTLDFQENSYTFFDYQRSCYVEVRGRISYQQKCRRVNLNLGQIGEYACSNKNQNREYIKYDEQRKYQDYGQYCLSMLYFGLGHILNLQCKESPQINHCVQALANSGVITKQKEIISHNILSLCSEGVNPILANSILSKMDDENKRKLHLLVLTHSVLTSPELRNKQGDHPPSSIWHKTGYLQSCLDILVKCMTFLEETDKEINILSFDDIVLNFQISIEVYHFILKEYQRICKLLKIENIKWSELIDEEFQELLQELITIFRPAVGTFSGSRRLGYLFKGANKGFIAHRQCLMSYFNEKPNFIFVTKMLIDSENEKPVILSCNYVRDDILISTYGCLPTLSKQSFGECEIQFHNISTAIFSHLSKFNGLQMDIFEKENECSIQANSELNAITIQCSKEKQKQINEKFGKMLQDIEDMFKKQTKLFKQSNLLRVIVGAGGQISQLLVLEKGKNSQIMDMAIVKNLAPEVGIEQLKELFDEFIQLKDIKIVPKPQSNQAIVSFYSAEDFRKFYQFFSGCTYYDYTMIVHPYVDDTKQISEEQYLLFEWNVWKTVGEALVQFSSVQAAKSALTNFKILAGQNARVQQKTSMIFAEGLDSKVDEKDIVSWVSGNGPIINVQVRRFAPSRAVNQEVSVKGVIANAFPKQNIQCHTGKIIKGRNGHRSCQVVIGNRESASEVMFALNQVSGILGNGKLYVTPVFTFPVDLPEAQQSYALVYQDIVKDLSKQLGRFQPIQTELIKNPLKWTLIIKSNQEDQMTIIKNILPQRLKSVPLNIKLQDTSLLFTELAQKNFDKLEKKLPVKIMPDVIDKKIKVLCKPSTVLLIEKQINTQIMESFIFQIPLYEKAYLFLQKNINQIVSQEIKNGLKFRFEPINKNIQLQGNLSVLEKTRQKINKALVNLKKKVEQNRTLAENICGLCYDELKHPFKLQGCGESFCLTCLEDSIRYVVKDITLYPIKCPCCRQKIWISDLRCLLQESEWAQILKTAINHFIYTRPGEFIFCMTAGCTFICNVKYKSSYSCPECKKGYCLNCKNLIHIGMTCHEARYGSDRLFGEYMQAVGARVCANRDCKAPIQRISGCFKVQCSRCKKCMCFKCPPQSMIPYETPEETYNHMNRAHGGCF